MSKIKDIGEIESVIVHWSESNVINDELGCNDDCDIEKEVSPQVLDKIIERAAKGVKGGYGKTSLTIKLKSGAVWAEHHKFYLHGGDRGLLSMINSER